MQTPNDDAAQSGGLRLDAHEIADARFVKPSAVIDHEDRSMRRLVDRFEKDVNAAHVAHGDGPARNARAFDQRAQRDAAWTNAYPQARIGQVRSR
jgi:hypothetical protein